MIFIGKNAFNLLYLTVSMVFEFKRKFQAADLFNDYARDFFNSKQFQTAKILYTGALALDWTNPKYWTNRAFMSYQLALLILEEDFHEALREDLYTILSKK